VALHPPRIRLARPEDTARIAAGNRAMARETEDLDLDPAKVAAGVERTFRDDVGARYWVAEIDGMVAAQLMITVEWSDWRNRFVWWVQSVYVWPPYRGRGLYRGLYGAVRQAAIDADAAGIRLYVDQRNERAQGVYTALGMAGDHYRVFEDMFDHA
jgi:GNAT superfamily N-acetyltransferase